MNTELVVIWDGAHHGQDLDLLCDGIRIAEKLAAPDGRRSRGSAKTILLEALPTFRTKALTFHELIAVTGLTAPAANSGLYQLRRDGILQSEPVPDGYQGHGLQKLYWRWPV